MELVSSKLEMKGLVASTRVERKDTSPRRWNAGTTSTSSCSDNAQKQESRALGSGKSLISLKTYFRKLRVFKGTVKALINLRRFPVLTKAATGIGVGAAGPKQDRHSQRRPTAMIARISTDDDALQAVQSQVKSLVEDGHVITEIDHGQGDKVTYRLQGDLEHYTEDNLRKRAALETHPHMIALTHRLWLSAVQEDEENLSFLEYEAFMLRLHRLILPEFDLNDSKELIHDDWNRDANGADHLDYRFFHLSMFELVDLWTDTVDSEDYISLLYCIVHSLTFAWNAKYILKPLEDICPVDILEESKAVSMEEISKDLEAEVNSETAQVYRDRLKLPEEHQGESDNDKDASGSGENMQPLSKEEGVTVVDETPSLLPEAPSNKVEGGLVDPAPATHPEPQVPSLPHPVESELSRSAEATQREPKRPRSSDASMHKKSVSRASSSSAENDHKLMRLASAISRQQKHLDIESAALKTSVVFDPFADFYANSNSSGAGRSGHLNVQGRQSFQGNARSLKQGSVSSSFGDNNGVVLSIGVTDGSDSVNMVSRPSFVVKPSAIASTLNQSLVGAGVNWRDFYQDTNGGGSEYSSREFGVSGQEVLRGNKFDFGRVEKQQTQPAGAVSPRKSTSGVSGGGSLSTSEYLRINQAYTGAQLEKREQQQLNATLKVNEQRDGVSTLSGDHPSFSVISTPISPRSRSAAYKRPSSQSHSHRTSTFGTAAQYDYTHQRLEMNGTRVSDSRSGVRPGGLSVNSIDSASNNTNHFADHIGTPPQQYQQQLSPRSHRIHSQQQQQSRTSSSPLKLVDGLQGLTITSAQPLGSSSTPVSSSSTSPAPVRSLRRSTDGASLVALSSSIVSAALDLDPSTNAFSLPSPRAGLGLTSLHNNATTTTSTVPPGRQPPSPRKSSHHHSHQGSASSRRSMLADESKRIQQQQQFSERIGQISVQSVPISPQK